MDDKDCWDKIDLEDLWVIDKLILAKRLGYLCGPAGVPPPVPAQYIVRPCVNFKMMARGAHIKFLSCTDYDIPDGYFWCEQFTGRHRSFDYNYGECVLGVEGFRSDERLDRFSKWERIDEGFVLPEPLKKIAKKYEWLNIETIDDKIIEVHFRYNDDFRGHSSKVIYPVWKEDFYESRCGDRIGFLLQSPLTPR